MERGDDVENVDSGVKGSMGVMETSDGPTKIVVGTSCNGDTLCGS